TSRAPRQRWTSLLRLEYSCPATQVRAGGAVCVNFPLPPFSMSWSIQHVWYVGGNDDHGATQRCDITGVTQPGTLRAPGKTRMCDQQGFRRPRCSLRLFSRGSEATRPYSPGEREKCANTLF